MSEKHVYLLLNKHFYIFRGFSFFFAKSKFFDHYDDEPLRPNSNQEKHHKKKETVFQKISIVFLSGKIARIGPPFK